MVERFCREHGGFHDMPGDPDCRFEDGFGNEIDPADFED